MDGVISIAGVLALLLAAGTALGLIDRKAFSLRWLLIAAALVLLNDFLLSRGYGLLPKLVPAAHWNWQGKVLALAATLGVAALPAFSWKRCGLTFVQARGSLKSVLPFAVVYSAIFVVLAFIFPDHEKPSAETLAFQLTMPGLEEEPFYRGVLLLALDRAFSARVKWLGVEWGWGAVLSCTLFGLAHAFRYSHGHFGFEPLTMALTALPSFIGFWVRVRTGSLLIPVVLHNWGNSIPLVLPPR